MLLDFQGFQEYTKQFSSKTLILSISKVLQKILRFHSHISNYAKHLPTPTSFDICQIVPTIFHLYDKMYLYFPSNNEIDLLVEEYFLKNRNTEECNQIIIDVIQGHKLIQKERNMYQKLLCIQLHLTNLLYHF